MYMKGLVVPRGNVTSGDQEWITFEQMICKALDAGGFQYNREVVYFGDHLEKMSGVDFVIYAHKTRRDLFANLYHKQMHMRYLFTLDHLGWGADHSKKITGTDFEGIEKQKAINFCTGLRNKFLNQGDSKFAQPQINLAKDFPTSFVFFPLQRPGDDTIMFHAPKEVDETVVMLSKWASSRKQNVVFKFHPGNKNDPDLVRCVNDCVKNYSNVFLYEGNIHDFIDRSEGVIVINSGVGFESLIHGKPVVTLGACDYQQVTFKATEERLDEARDYIYNYSREQSIMTWKFIYYYFFHHAYCIEEEYKEAAYLRLYEYLSKAIKRNTISV
ncbi:MAG: hypothetical protein ACI8VT_001828 [Saprospiraceae bacterium]|jgi:hypothetical protein